MSNAKTTPALRGPALVRAVSTAERFAESSARIGTESIQAAGRRLKTLRGASAVAAGLQQVSCAMRYVALTHRMRLCIDPAVPTS